MIPIVRLYPIPLSFRSLFNHGSKDHYLTLPQALEQALESDLEAGGTERRGIFRASIETLRKISNGSLEKLSQLILFLLPSFLTPWMRHECLERRQPDETAFLDGLRGFASFIILVHHFSEQYQFEIDVGFGRDEQRSIFRLPVIRTFYSGGPMVAVFFVISGYALSYKALNLSRHQSWESLFHKVASSIFRRGIRLFLPTCFTSFLVMLTVRLRIYNFAFDSQAPDPVDSYLEYFPTLWEQLLDWLDFVLNALIAPWPRSTPHFRYDTHLWTIPIEFESSILIFVSVIGLSQIRPRLRQIIMVLISCAALARDSWTSAIFFGGMLLADFDLGRSQRSKEMCEARVGSKMLSGFLCFFNLVGGLYLASYPPKMGDTTPGYVWMSRITPSYRKWCALGALEIVWSICNSGTLRRVFSTTPAQYMGRISYALYLVHGPFLQCCGFYVVPVLWRILGRETELKYQLSVWLGFAMVTPAVIWIADIFWRAVDETCVKLAHWTEMKCR